MSRSFIDTLFLTAPSSTTCEEKTDIGFLMDSSGSVRRKYSTQKEFVKRVAASFGISDVGSRAGVVTYSHYAGIK